MKTKFFAFALSLLFAMPCVLCAEETEIQLTEVIGINVLPGCGVCKLKMPNKICKKITKICIC